MLAESLYRTLYTRGFSRFVTYPTALVATGRSESYRTGFEPVEKQRIFTAHDKVELKNAGVFRRKPMRILSVPWKIYWKFINVSIVYDEHDVLVCMDETSKQQVQETRIPLAPESGKPGKYDYEYERNGVSNLFMLFAPIEGWRHVKVTDRHTKIDWANLIKELVDEHYPDKKIILVMDNLNTHKLGSLYEAFAPEEARRIAGRLEIHYTP